MARLIVKNVGPIKDVDIELKKVNVFMGPQGCGKSSLAKIISFCSWMEKDNEATSRAEVLGIANALSSFHRMDGYFREDSQLAYFGDDVVLFHQYPDTLPYFGNCDDYAVFHLHDGDMLFRKHQKSVNPKVAYIPAERNFVSVVPNLKKYQEKDDSLQSFVNDWFEAKRVFTESRPLEIKILGISYYYNAKTDSDVVIVDGQKIRLSQSSSGFQSVVPLMVLLSYLSSGIYKENKPFSPEENQQMRDILAHVSSGSENDMEQKVIDRIRGFLQGKVYTHTQFVIEEPEQNLYPEAQCELVCHLLSCLNHGKSHRAVITTHSPYVLYALNNCLLANIVRKDVPTEEMLPSWYRDVIIDPSEVAVWEIEDGLMKTYDGLGSNSTIQDKDGLIRKNYFNNVMGKVMNDFQNLLMYKD